MKLFFKPKEAAERLSVSTRTLANKRALGNGPPFLKMDGVIRYPLDSLERYINKNLQSLFTTLAKLYYITTIFFIY